MTFDNLPGHLRVAGVAWVVAESVKYSKTREVYIRAHHWAVMRGLPTDTPQDHEAAAADASAYAAEHADDVEQFLAYKDRMDRREVSP